MHLVPVQMLVQIWNFHLVRKLVAISRTGSSVPLISLENISISSPGNWSRLVAKVVGRDVALQPAPSSDWRRAIALFQNRSRTVYHRCPHPSSSMHRLLLAEEIGRSRGEGEARAGVKIPALWRPNQTETRESEQNARNSETGPEPNQCCKLRRIDRWWPRGACPPPFWP